MPLLDKLLTERGKRMTTKKKTQPLHKGINKEDLDNQPIPDNKLLNPNKQCNAKTKRRYIPIATILRHANRGLSDLEISRIIGCSRPNVSIRLKPYREALTSLPDYQKKELDLIDLAKQGILEEIIRRVYSGEDLKKYSLPQLTMSFGILTDKGQSIKGKAPAAASNLQVNINFDPGMLPQSDGSKHLEKDNQVIMVDMDSGGNSGGNNEGDK
jgi:hypothetical protein